MQTEKRGLDPRVVPLVEYFNSQGLKTAMSCQGHNKTNVSMFWIQFDSTVTRDDILQFMCKHLNKYGCFCSNGRFANRLIGYKNQSTGEPSYMESWNYFAATIEAADNDLKRWKQ